MFGALAGVLLLAAGDAAAGPDDPSVFDDSKYASQKAVYDFNFETPEDLKGALGTVRNYLMAIREFGDPQSSRTSSSRMATRSTPCPGSIGPHSPGSTAR